MFDKRTLIAFLLIGLIIIFSPAYYRLITDKQLPADTLTTNDRVYNSSSEIPGNNYNLIEDEVLNEFSLPILDTIPEKIFSIETNLFTADLSSKAGGSFISFKLKDYVDYKKDFVELIDQKSGSINLGVEYKNIVGDEIFLDNNFYTSVSDNSYIRVSDRPYHIYFTQPVDNTTITKTLIFYPDSYVIDVVIDLTDLKRLGLIQNSFLLKWNGGLPLTENNHKDDISYFSAAIYQGGEIITHSRKSNKSVSGSGLTDWTAIRTKYFTSAFIPQTESDFGQIFVNNDHDKIRNALNYPTYNMEIGLISEELAQVKLYLGPLKYDYIKSLNVELEKIMNFGWAIIQPISHGVLLLLTFLYNYVPNYGLLLIVFSLIVKIVVYPLTKKSYLSTQEMQAVQPLVAKMKEKYKNDPQRLNKETMKLYKEHGVNPLGGCLPLLLQMPLLMALFIVFRSTIELRGAPFIFWIQDLSAPDTIFNLPFNIPIYGDQVSLLPLLMGVTMFIQQKSMAVQSSGQSKYMSHFMTVFFVLLFNSFPSGLNLYYTLFNLLTILQQKYLTPSKRTLKPA
tara:strand:- start:20137 stop:21828 length:1692 start_codon:yes stop_codon:yes gene_type:complete